MEVFGALVDDMVRECDYHRAHPNEDLARLRDLNRGVFAPEDLSRKYEPFRT